MRVINVTGWVITHESVHKVAGVEQEATVDVTEKVVLAEDVISATSATSMDISHANAKKIKTFAIVAVALGTLRKTANRGLK